MMHSRWMTWPFLNIINGRVRVVHYGTVLTIMQVLFLNMHHITTNYECDADANKRSLSKGYSYCLKKSILR